MCGRYTMLADELKVMKAFQFENRVMDFAKSYNVAPGQEVLAVIHDGRIRRAGYLKWGLVPAFAKDEKSAFKMINARSETAHVKASFRNLMAKRRCLIIADSFYEWQKSSKESKPYRIQVKDRDLFAFAGLWDKYEQDGKVLFTCTILTKNSNAFMENIHHRMPIILPRDKESAWLNPQMKRGQDAFRFLQSVEAETFSAYPVTDYVNKAANNDANCIRKFV